MAKTILVVEDELLIRLDIYSALTAGGFVCLEQSSAEGAQTVLRMDEDVQALVTDVKLNDPMSGLELAVWTRQHRAYVKIVVVSGHTPSEEAARISDAAFGKPFRTDQILAAVNRLLA